MICRECGAELPPDAAFCHKCGVKQAKKRKKKAGKKTRANGDGYIYKRGKTYTAIVTRRKGGFQSKSKGGFKTLAEAKAYIPTLKDELGLSERQRVISFCDLYAEWSEKKYCGMLGRAIGTSTITAYKIAYKRCEPLYLLEDFRAIHYPEMQLVIDGLISYDTQKDVKELFSQMSKYGMKMEYCERNYAPLLDLTNYTAPEKEAFTDEEVMALWLDYLGDAGELKPHPFTGYILIMINCGLRYGELSTISKENIHFDEHYMMGGIKSELSRNTPIAIPDEIEPVIMEKYEKGRSKLLHMNEANFYEAFYEACERAGVRRLTPHCCRHTYITRLTRAKTPPAIIQKGARHSDYKTTLGYTHMNIDDVIAAVNRLPKLSEDCKKAMAQSNANRT